ncbi:uncharacterized protein UTRI_03561_B [Ustilago trichophora]|uniref:Uncharacterized protein n=1 Tax=Ustilago trichophora TaxID=86804 RepID=A0A5C3E303_9BASI|nr:uncharacterized protein UTRI_03561_B [Ustilago trichophora]
MRVSSSLLLILAAITVANAGVVDTATNPKHKLVRIKNGNAHVNALDTAKAKVHPDLKNLKQLVSVAAKRGLDLGALNDSAHANVNAVDLKHVASIVHTLSASLESHNKEADSILKTKDQKVAAVKTEKLLGSVKASLADAVVDIHSLTAKKAKTGHVAKLAVLRRDVLQAVDLNTVTDLVRSANISGATGLVSLLSGLKTDSVLQGDAISVLSNVDVIKTVHEVANVDTVLGSVVAVPAAVPLTEALKDLDSPVSFVSALADIKSISSLVAAAPGGLDSITKVDGAEKLVAYVHKFGFNTVARVFCVGGVEKVLTTVVAVPGSVKLLDSLKSVADVPAFVSGLHVLDVPSFVSSIQAIDNISALTDVMSLVHGVAPLEKRAELLQGVQGTIAGLDVGKLVSLKRSLAHIAALPDSDLVSIEENAKRALLNDVELGAVLANLDVAKLALLKRSIVDLSMLSEKEVDALRAAMKRDLLDGLPVGGIVSGLPVGGVLSSVEGTTGGLLKRDLLSGLPVDGIVSDLPVGGVLSSVEGTTGSLLKRDLLSGLPLKNVAGTDGILGTVKGTVGPATKKLPVHVGTVDKIKREVLSTLSGGGSGDLLGEGHAALNAVDTNGGSAADLGGAGDGLLGTGGGDISLLDLNRILAVVKRSDLLKPIQGTISDLDLAKILPQLKRELVAADADADTNPTFDMVGDAYTTATGLYSRKTDAVDTILLEHSIDTFSTDAGSMLNKMVLITDAIHSDAITSDVKTQVAPLVAAVSKSLDSIVKVKAPKLTGKVEKVTDLAEKTAASLH